MVFDYKDVHTLMMFLTEEGKIVPGRVSGLSASQQRELTLAIKRARHLSLISPVRRESVH
jgi:small subunit ribosomal protein S18